MTELSPLAPELQALLDAERERPGPDAATVDRVFSRVASSIAVLPPGGGDGGGGGPAPEGTMPSPANTLPPAAAPLGATGGLFASLAKPAAIAAIAFSGGALLGGSVMARYDARPAAIVRTPPKIVIVATPSAPSPLPDQAAPGASELESEAKPAQRTAAGNSKAGAEPAGRDIDLGKERALLATARTALSKGDGAAALAALDRHAAQFPNGRLSEERASLRVQALLLKGDRSAAQREADAFKSKFPKSLLKGAVEKSIEQE
ncbi:MAG: hypothetical protein U0263_03815 [Polyangiaceae bacterium]